ncbi:MAG TPA: cyclic nucleotide-binding domain-containing protein, partial [Bryobacteraceae bacterium]|nr:cyclic nucleotide-binding domain-containing protein [Bryobacteraceae bacterium]
DLLTGLSQEDARAVMSLGATRFLSGGSELFHLGDRADSLFLVERGRVRLTLPMQVRGRDEDVLVEERSTGQTVGWSALIPPYRFTLSATAPVDTDVIAISRDALRAYFAAHPDVGNVVCLNVAAVIGQRLQLFQAMWLREMQRMVELRCA